MSLWEGMTGKTWLGLTDQGTFHGAGAQLPCCSPRKLFHQLAIEVLPSVISTREDNSAFLSWAMM